VPLPITSGGEETNLARETATVFVPERAGGYARCLDDVLYVKEQVWYSDFEVVDPRCAQIQEGLVNAAADGKLDEIRDALKKGASIRSSAFAKYSSDPRKPIFAAAWGRQPAAVRLLLDNGAGLNESYVCCMDSKSLLMLAVSLNEESMTKMLLDRGASLDFTNPFEGADVFDEATRIGNPKIVTLLNNACESTVANRVYCRTRPIRKLVLWLRS
jgi:hypothetical protein